MILFIAIACVLAKAHKLRVRPVLLEWSLFPLYVTEFIFWVFQICAWCGDYRFIPYASLLQNAYILVLLVPILKFRMYKAACIGAGMVFSGTLLNRLVMNANGGKMPVFPTLSRFTHYFRDGALEAAEDSVHCLMDSQTSLNVLGDWIDVGFSIMSIGDVLIHGFVLLIVYRTIVELNRGKKND